MHISLPAIRKTCVVGIVATGIGLGALLGPLAGAQAAPVAGAVKPTVVLVHGSFADASGWTDVVKRLQKEGYTVKAPAVAMRDVAGDAAYLASVLKQTPGPIVLVGHSYGGAVITNAAASDPDVKALVYIAGYVPDVGESLADLSARPVAHPIPPLPLQPNTYPRPDGTEGVELYIDPARFRDAFLGDEVSRATARAMAATQRPVTGAALNAKTTTASWKTIPSWYLVAGNDHAIAPDLERFMARRAGAHTVEVKTAHAAMVTDPSAVTRLIKEAARATR